MQTPECPIDEASASTAAPRSGAESLLFRPRDLADTLGVSLRTLWRLDATAKLPRAVYLGTAKRWRRREVAAWVAAGCPARSEWDARGALPRERE